MEVISVNRGKARTLDWQGTEVSTGIFKYPVNGPIELGFTDVVEDDVVDRKNHGGVDKAVYAYSLDHYPFWRDHYPDIDWQNGIFGENLTVSGMNEEKLLIGSIYNIGEAQVQVCQPRQPCFNLGVRFNSQTILKQFINQPFPGVYFRVLQEGRVRPGDSFNPISIQSDSPSITEVFSLLFHKQDNEKTIAKAMECEYLPTKCKTRIEKIQEL